MTIAQLKTHMDRRFDRLQRTKADKADLARFATKADLARFATKADFARFATKADLTRFATKADLTRFATKTDLTRFATKDDLAHVETAVRTLSLEMRRQFESLTSKLDSVIHEFREKYRHHDRVLGEHELRISDLERQIG